MDHPPLLRDESHRFAEFIRTSVSHEDAVTGIANCEMTNDDCIDLLNDIGDFEDIDEYLLTHLAAKHEFHNQKQLDYVGVIGSRADVSSLKFQLFRMRTLFLSVRSDFFNGSGITRQQRRVMCKSNALVYALLHKCLKSVDYTKAYEKVPTMTLDKCTQFQSEELALWLSCFGEDGPSSKLYVDWNVFYKNFSAKLVQMPAPEDEKALKRLIDVNSTDYVSRKYFDNFLRVFGPLKNSLVNVTKLFSERWFHGFLSPFEGESFLWNEPVGTYLVRISQSRTDCFALQIVQRKQQIDTVSIICHAPSSYSLQVVSGLDQPRQTKKFPSIEALLDDFKDVLKTPFKTKNHLTKPWFHGSLSLADAKSLLNSRGVCGTFLFHLIPSQSILQTYTCSWVNQYGFCMQVPLEKCVDGFRAVDPEYVNTSFPDLESFIAAHCEIIKYPYDDERVPRLECNYLDDEDEEFEPWTYEACGPQGNQFTATTLTTPYPPATLIHGASMSTYPAGTGGDQVYCDFYRVSVVNNRCIIALADGCNWGKRPRRAAEVATKAVVNYLSTDEFFEDTWIVKSRLLEAFKLAQKAIVEERSDTWDPGTTTLLASMLIKVKPISVKAPEYAIVCASVGDCKAFHWNCTTQVFTDITKGNRGTRDPSDPGGRLGPRLKGDLPDLRNLMTCYFPCYEGDIIVFVTDGVHDNLDPEELGEEVSALGLPELAKYNTWEDVPNHEIEKVKSMYMCHKLARLLNCLQDKSPEKFARALLDHCKATTKKTRDFMEQNPQASEPRNYREYPGKMDHTTCVCVRVGQFVPSNIIRIKKKKLTVEKQKTRRNSSSPGRDKDKKRSNKYEIKSTHASKEKFSPSPTRRRRILSESMIDPSMIKKDPFQALYDMHVVNHVALAFRKFHPDLAVFIKTERHSPRSETQTVLYHPKPVATLHRSLDNKLLPALSKKPSAAGDLSTSASVVKSTGPTLTKLIYNPYFINGRTENALQKTSPEARAGQAKTVDLENMRKSSAPKRQALVQNQKAPLIQRRKSGVSDLLCDEIFVAAALTFTIFANGFGNAQSILPHKVSTQNLCHFYRLEISATRNICSLCTTLDETSCSNIALSASKSLLNALEHIHVPDSKTSMSSCLEAIKAASQALEMKKKCAPLGVTACITSWLCDLQGGRGPSKWIMACCNVGFNKVYRYSTLKQELFDLTPNNYVPNSDEGYSFGYNANSVKLFQYTKMFSLLIEDDSDFIIILSPLVYHNFDPEMTGGKIPKEYFQEYNVWKGVKRWDKVPYHDPLRARLRLLQTAEPLKALPNLSARNIVQILSQAAQNSTNRREIRKSNAIQQAVTGVGTCIAFRVGEAQEIPNFEVEGPLINMSQDNSQPLPPAQREGQRDKTTGETLRGTIFVPLKAKQTES